MPEVFSKDGQEYQIGGPNNDSIGLVVQINSLPEELAIDGYHLVRKPNFHVTLLPVGNLVSRYKINIPNAFDTVLQHFKKFLDQYPIRLDNFTNEFRLASQNDLRTIVAMCTIENVGHFYDSLNSKFGLNLEVPPTHVTLYTLNGGPGIFLIDSTDIKQLTKKIENLGINLSGGSLKNFPLKR